jgi:uncharacterized membrane protein
VGSDGITTFRVIITYNFAFSLVLTGPIVRLVTRCLADQIYDRNVEDAPGMLMGAILLSFCIQAPIVLLFYFFAIDLPIPVKVHAIVNYFLVSGLWIVGVFLSALKAYTAVTLTFAIGLFISFALSYFGAQTGSIDGMLMGFNAGIAVIFFVLIGRTFAEYPYPLKRMFGWTRKARVYWSIALSGLIYNLAIWVDKWVMWFAPEREVLSNGFIYYGVYDGAMFLAFLSIVPSMAIFMLNLETRFYERYVQFYRDIENHVTLERIEQNHRTLLNELLGGIRNLIVFQATVSLLCIIFATDIFDALGFNYLQLGIFRFGLLGSFFHTLFLVLTVVLSYFDLRKQVLFVNLVLMFTSLVFTWLSIGQGFAYYGFGYFSAALFSFLVAALITFRELNRVPYNTFIKRQAA